MIGGCPGPASSTGPANASASLAVASRSRARRRTAARRRAPIPRRAARGPARVPSTRGRRRGSRRPPGDLGRDPSRPRWPSRRRGCRRPRSCAGTASVPPARTIARRPDRRDRERARGVHRRPGHRAPSRTRADGPLRRGARGPPEHARRCRCERARPRSGRQQRAPREAGNGHAPIKHPTDRRRAPTSALLCEFSSGGRRPPCGPAPLLRSSLRVTPRSRRHATLRVCFGNPTGSS